MAERLLLDGGKVKVTIMFRGREITYTSYGKRLLDRISVDLQNIATVERDAKLEGKNMFLILAPRQTPLGPPRFVHHKDEPAPTVEQTEHVGEHVDDHVDEHIDDHAETEHSGNGATVLASDTVHEPAKEAPTHA
jgi:hypothetical protein